MMYKAYKIRIYPTAEQKIQIDKFIGGCRYIWNYMLELQMKKYYNKEKHMTKYDMNYYLTELKKQRGYTWLNEIPASSLCQTCANLEMAFQNLFHHRGKMPRFKSKKRNKGYPAGQYFYFNSDTVYIGKLGNVKYRSDIKFPKGRENGKLYDRANLFIDDNKYYIVFVMKCESQTQNLTDNAMGIDLGIKELATVAYGDSELVFHNINKSRQMRLLEKKIKFIQHSLSRKIRMSIKNNGKYVRTNNIERECRKLNKLFCRRSNIKRNYIHQVTNQLIQLKPCAVVMEDLNLQEMMKNKLIASYVHDQCFSRFLLCMKQKCAQNNIPFIKADTYYPSTQLCSRCGAKKKLSLHDRVYRCDLCGLIIDRDYNAAINLMKYSA